MKNKLTDLTNHLFVQIERLSDEELTPEQIAKEVTRTDAIVKVSEQIINSATITLRGAELLAEYGGTGKFEHLLPAMGQDPKVIEGAQEMSRRGHSIPYSPKELAWIKRTRAMPRRAAHALFCETFGRHDVILDNFKALCTRNGWTTGRTGYFPNGGTPANKGKRMPYRANSARTQFKKGQLPHNTKSLGAERVTVDGYVEISIAEANPHTGFWRRYVLKHRYLWGQQHGPVPAGHVLKCRDGNRLNTDPSNWMLLSRSLLPFINGHRGPHYDQAAPEVRLAILTLAKLKHARFEKTKERTR